MDVRQVLSGFEPWMCTGEGMAEAIGFPDPQRYNEIPSGYVEGLDNAAGEAYGVWFFAGAYFYPVFYGGGEKWADTLS